MLKVFIIFQGRLFEQGEPAEEKLEIGFINSMISKMNQIR